MSTLNNSKKQGTIQQQCKLGVSQQVGGGSDWSDSFYAYTANPAELSRYTLKHIDQAPMFNPLECNTVIPTGTSGITPTGVYLANHPSKNIQSSNYNYKAKCGQLAGQLGGGASQQVGTLGASQQVGGVAYYPGNRPLGVENLGIVCGPKGRCQVHYASTNKAGPGCKKCGSCNESPSIYRPNQSVASGSVFNYSAGCEFQPEACQKAYSQLMAMDKQRLWGLCHDNHVRIYDTDQETGRLTPRNKGKMCKRLLHKLKKSGKLGQVVGV